MDYKQQMTKTELITQVADFYGRRLDLEKALTIFEIEFGYQPEIVEPKPLVDQDFINSMDFPECVTVEALTYMKELQESGVVNMFMSGTHIQQALEIDRDDAREILGVYMKYYTEIYFPEEIL